MISVKITFKHHALRFTYDKLTAVCDIPMLDAEKLEDKLIFACLEELRVRIAKRLLTQRATYAFTFKPHEALAFTLAYERGFIASSNIWSQTILRSTHDTLHQALS